MGLLNTIWWTTGLLMAAPLFGLGVNNVLAGSYASGVPFIVLALIVLFLPEYVRWQLFGGSSPFERIPLIGTRGEQDET